MGHNFVKTEFATLIDKKLAINYFSLFGQLVVTVNSEISSSSIENASQKFANANIIEKHKEKKTTCCMWSHPGSERNLY